MKTARICGENQAGRPASTRIIRLRIFRGSSRRFGEAATWIPNYVIVTMPRKYALAVLTVEVDGPGAVLVDLLDDLHELLVVQLGLQLQQNALQRLDREVTDACENRTG